jgi:hypothetical protein
VFLAILVNINPVGIAAGGVGLEDSEKKVLQAAAWQQCRPRK